MPKTSIRPNPEASQALDDASSRLGTSRSREAELILERIAAGIPAAATAHVPAVPPLSVRVEENVLERAKAQSAEAGRSLSDAFNWVLTSGDWPASRGAGDDGHVIEVEVRASRDEPRGWAVDVARADERLAHERLRARYGDGVRVIGRTRFGDEIGYPRIWVPLDAADSIDALEAALEEIGLKRSRG